MQCTSFISFRRTVRSFMVILLSIFLIVLQTVFAADGVSRQVQNCQAAAAAFEKSGDVAGAQAEYQKIIQASPHTPHGLEACAQRGRLYVNQKQYAALRPVVEQICTNFQDQPGIFRVLSGLTKDCMYAKAYPEALSVCTEAQSRLSSHPRATLVTGWLGMVYAHQGDFEGAEQMKQMLLEKEDVIASDFLDAMCDIGWGYYCAGQWDQALAAYREGLEQNSTHKNAVYLQYQVIKTHLAREDFEAADREMDVLLTQYGHRDKTPGLAFRLGNEYYDKGQYQGAIAVYEKLLAQFNEHELVPAVQDMEVKTYQMMANRYRRQRQPEQAAAAYAAVIERFPEHAQIPSIRDAIVETYADAGNLTKARQALQTDIEQCPHRRELLRMIARVAVETARTGNTDTAQQLTDAIFEQNPEDADQQLFGYTTLARVYVHQGKHTKAAAAIDRALKRYKSHPDALAYHLFGVGEEYFFLAQEATQQQESDLAVLYYRQAIEIWQHLLNELPENDNPHYPYYLGVSYQNIEQMDQAIECYRTVVTKWPDYKRAWYAQYMVAVCFDRMFNNEQISYDKAALHIREACRILDARYPNSQGASAAQLLLKHYADAGAVSSVIGH